jgi:hypothetical protein
MVMRTKPLSGEKIPTAMVACVCTGANMMQKEYFKVDRLINGHGECFAKVLWDGVPPFSWSPSEVASFRWHLSLSFSFSVYWLE